MELPNALRRSSSVTVTSDQTDVVSDGWPTSLTCCDNVLCSRLAGSFPLGIAALQSFLPARPSLSRHSFPVLVD